jgi:hypothetical protein
MRVTAQQEAVFQELVHKAEQHSAAATPTFEKEFRSRKKDDLWFLRRQIGGAELTLNFPAAKQVGGRTVLETMMQSDRYMNVHEVGHSCGVPVGFGRDAFEIDQFGYPALPQPPTTDAQLDRPRYGAINVFVSGGGAAPGYGDCALVLHPDVQTRCTITLMDSLDKHGPPIGAQSPDAFDHCLLHRMKEGPYWERWVAGLLKAARGMADPTTNINSYIEAQIHAVVEFPADVLYLRGSFESQFGTETGERLQHWARTHDWALVWGVQDQMLLDSTVQFPIVTDPHVRRPNWSDYLVAQAERFAQFWTRHKNQNAGRALAQNSRADWSLLWEAMPPAQRYSPNQTETVPVTMNSLRQRLQRAPQPAPAPAPPVTPA